MAAPTLAPAPGRRLAGPTAKQLLWFVLTLAALSVLIFSEVPLLHTGTRFDGYREKLIHDRLFLFPHALCGAIALLSGPLQFSTRLRRRTPRFHRILGRLYVGAVFVAAPLAILLSTGSGVIVGTWVQASTWVLCTVAALLSARNRHFLQHRQWMIRSYAVTFTFIALRVPNPWPGYFTLPDNIVVDLILVVTLLSVALSDLAFDWRELTTRRS